MIINQMTNFNKKNTTKSTTCVYLDNRYDDEIIHKTGQV